ncbi:MAG: methylmalonyl Co-A mutase-associated GTPase MeaB [Chthoniobacterales bacterium]|nr:methylmalonyl Co-A mutase-associated GTPase MeaB [Chthoniobacterales bacterium]
MPRKRSPRRFPGCLRSDAFRPIHGTVCRAGNCRPTNPLNPKTTNVLPAADYAAGISAGDTSVLARAITLVESTSTRHAQTAAELMRLLLAVKNSSVRVGITGVPGVGKSTFIEAFGLHLCEQGHRVAVLAVDPTSAISGGSILGDKTRMEKLSRHPSAYIRPSPSGGALGGVTRKTRETITLCEAAGYNVILVETVGVGQSEIAVRSMTDFFLLLALTGAGDDLQGIKKGIVEMADGIAVTKADGENVTAAERLKLELAQVLHFLTAATAGWRPEVLTCSALKGNGIADVWKLVERFRVEMQTSGEWDVRRLSQVQEGLIDFAREQVLAGMMESAVVRKDVGNFGVSVAEGRMTMRDAATRIAGDFVASR